MYLDSTITQLENDVWFINSSSSFHMTPYKEFFCEYEKYNGGDVFLRDDSTTKITGHGRDKLLLKDGRIKTLHGVLHSPCLDRNLIFLRKMFNASVHTVFEKDRCKMV